MATELKKPTREYVDVDFLFQPHPVSKNLTVKKSTNAVRQSILHLMRLKEGDKPFHPEIQSPIYKYFFENFTITTKIVLQEEVRKYITYYEPRVTLTDVQIGFPEPNAINCTIFGIIINTNEYFSVNVLINRLR